MAVEIINTGNKEYLEVLYRFDDEKLELFDHQLVYTYPKTTSSKIQFLGNDYIPTNIHITPKMHGPVPLLGNMFELVMECYHGAKKLLFCIGVEFNNKHEVYVDLEEPDFDRIFSKCKPPVLYQTKSGNFVFVTKTIISVAGTVPKLSSSSTCYKEIIENDSFDSSSAVDLMPRLVKVESKTSNVGLVKITEIEEGFVSGRDGSYMECKLLQDDGKQVYEEVAIVPLKTNTYERGMVTFSHFLHFFLVSVGAGVGFPNLLVTVFEHKDFTEGETGKKTRMFVGYGSFVMFFVVGLIMMLIGLADPKYKSRKNNKSAIKNGSVIATVGFYFLLIHCAFALGMVAFKKFRSEKFLQLFGWSQAIPTNNEDRISQTDGIGSFFDILHGMKL
jgi:hypothetical protein